ncbi:uncharacterized protein LOC100678677 [Nasonia vitripennis]|uniref:Uncharacterized protein n=1 Tax=Nasonia vitripennis TaxID=7425 RepID=A0A7M7LNC5_NASVI|nr:uncharacterized protein LOC100678677 [Nasonia vitripennis]
MHSAKNRLHNRTFSKSLVFSRPPRLALPLPFPLSFPSGPFEYPDVFISFDFISVQALFSCEENRRILQHVVDKAFDSTSTMSNDGKWMVLDREMNRDRQEIRDAYNKPDVKKIEDDEDVHHDVDDLVLVANQQSTGLIEVQTVEHDQYLHEIQYADLDGHLCNVNEFQHHQLMNSPQILDDMSHLDQQVYVVGGKRQLDPIDDYNNHKLEELQAHITEELNLRREEHKKKMELYTMHLQQGQEIHKERIKLLKAKLRKLQDEVHHIDYVICNRNLKRKFKSGPI